MKRKHLFEFEDYQWFPGWLRICMTRFIMAMHKVLGSNKEISSLLAKILNHSQKNQIIDLCSGSGGPMPAVVKVLETEFGYKNLKLFLSDLYPDLRAAKTINENDKKGLEYLTDPVDARNLQEFQGLRTLICSMHHMKPADARIILENASLESQPICVYEISDNSFPAWLWWIAIPTNIFMTFFITPLVRPLSWQQLVFTYLIPILPLLIAWDGAVSNARTYTLKDMDILLEGLESKKYVWEKGTVGGKVKKLYLLGYPK